jgi:hypothetical protein
MTLQGNFIWGSGGTTVDAFVQMSIDGGGTFVDVANFHFTTASARLILNVVSSASISPPTPRPMERFRSTPLSTACLEISYAANS